METNKVKPFTVTLSVKKLLFSTGQKGTIFPLILFYSNKKLREHNINGAVFQDLDKVEGVNTGAKIQVHFNETLGPTIKKVIKPAKEKWQTPTKCITCGSDLVVNGKEGLRCSNNFCPATSRGFLFKLMKHVDPNLSQTLIKEYFDGFVYNSTKNCVDNPAEFAIMFKQINDKNTRGRETQWVSQHGEEKGKLFWTIDVKVQDFLHSETLSTEVFWDVMNFPKLTEHEMKCLTTISPKLYLQARDRNSFEKLPRRCKNLIKENLDFIVWLNKFFENYGEKEWSK